MVLNRLCLAENSVRLLFVTYLQIQDCGNSPARSPHSNDLRCNYSTTKRDFDPAVLSGWSNRPFGCTGRQRVVDNGYGISVARLA